MNKDERRGKLEEILSAFAMRSGDWARSLSQNYSPTEDCDSVAEQIEALYAEKETDSGKD